MWGQTGRSNTWLRDNSEKENGKTLGRKLSEKRQNIIFKELKYFKSSNWYDPHSGQHSGF